MTIESQMRGLAAKYQITGDLSGVMQALGFGFPPDSPEEMHALTADVAYRLWIAQGRRHGFDVSDWLKAEDMIRSVVRIW